MPVSVTIGGTDVSSRLYASEQTSWNLVRGARGSCALPLLLGPADTLAVNAGDAIVISESDASVVWRGTVEALDLQWLNDDGWRVQTVTGVTLEQLFDTVQLDNVEYTDQDAGVIFADLVAKSGVTAVTLGTVSTGVRIKALKVTQISRGFDDLALACNFIWYVDPSDAKIYFHSATDRAAAWTITHGDVLFKSMSWRQSRADFRNAQLATSTGSALTSRTAVIPGTGSGSYTLPEIPGALLSVNVAKGTPATAKATATFTGQPSPGDTVTITRVTSPVTAGEEYEFVSALDNAQFGQVLIGSSAAETAQNLIDAINGDKDTAGTAYSSPTYPNPDVAANALSGLAFVLEAREPGATGNDIDLTESAANFTWSAASMTGGADQVLANDASWAIEWTPGSATINVTPGLTSDYSLMVSYLPLSAPAYATALGSDLTPKVVQRYTLGQTPTLAAALQQAQAILARFGSMPSQLALSTDKSGITIGRVATLSVDYPVGAGALLDGQWIVNEVDASLIYAKEAGDPYPSRFRYTLRLVNALDVPNFISAWEQTMNVGGGSNGGGVATNPDGSVSDSVGPAIVPVSDWVQEAPAGPKNALNKRFYLTYVPAISSATGEQILLFFKNGVALTPFNPDSVGGWGDKANSDYTLVENLVTVGVPPNDDDHLHAAYPPARGGSSGFEGGGPSPDATLVSVEIVCQTVITSPDFPACPAALTVTGVNDGLTDGAKGSADPSESGEWRIPILAPNLETFYVDEKAGSSIYWDSATEANDARFTVEDLHLEYTYSDGFVLERRPSSSEVLVSTDVRSGGVFDEEPQGHADISGDTATFQVWHTNGLSYTGGAPLVRWSEFA